MAPTPTSYLRSTSATVSSSSSSSSSSVSASKSSGASKRPNTTTTTTTILITTSPTPSQSPASPSPPPPQRPQCQQQREVFSLFRSTKPTGKVTYTLLYTSGETAEVPHHDILNHITMEQLQQYEHGSFEKGENMETSYYKRDSMGAWGGGSDRRKLERWLKRKKRELGVALVDDEEGEDGDKGMEAVERADKETGTEAEARKGKSAKERRRRMRKKEWSRRFKPLGREERRREIAEEREQLRAVGLDSELEDLDEFEDELEVDESAPEPGSNGRTVVSILESPSPSPSGSRAATPKRSPSLPTDSSPPPRMSTTTGRPSKRKLSSISDSLAAGSYSSPQASKSRTKSKAKPNDSIASIPEAAGSRFSKPLAGKSLLIQAVEDFRRQRSISTDVIAGTNGTSSPNDGSSSAIQRSLKRRRPVSVSDDGEASPDSDGRDVAAAPRNSDVMELDGESEDELAYAPVTASTKRKSLLLARAPASSSSARMRRSTSRSKSSTPKPPGRSATKASENTTKSTTTTTTKKSTSKSKGRSGTTKSKSKSRSVTPAQLPPQQEEEEEEGEGEEGENKDMYEVESIIDDYFIPESGDHMYLVKWKGYSEAENTWEPEENLRASKDLLQQYKKWRKRLDRMLS